MRIIMKIKKIISILISLTLVFTLFGMTVHSAEVSKPLLGDINNAGEIDVEDLLLIKKHVLGIITLTGEQFGRADVNGDTKADVEDLLLIKKHVLGLINLIELYPE